MINLITRSGEHKESRYLGFTIVEILVVVAVSAIIAGLALSYSSKGRNQVALYVEAQKMMEAVFKAKSLAVATYTNVPGSAKSCGYGLQVDYADQEYSIFSYVPSGSSTSCPQPSSIVSAPLVPTRQPVDNARYLYKPSQGVVLSNMGDSLDVVLFIPPAPKTLISRDFYGGGFSNLPSVIYLTTRDGSASLKISVDIEGQISIQ